MLLNTNRRLSTRRRSAFTLLEVLVVVAILVILATVATIATTRYIDDARKTKAHLAAQGIATAVDAYHENAANPYAGTAQGFPQSPNELVQPSFGGPSFLKNGQNDLIDPWGNQYQMQQATKSDGTVYLLIMTHAPDNTPISQFGIGPKAQPTF